jgi:hypothetical protein
MMADVTTMLISDAEGDMVLALTEDQQLVLRGAEVLEQELQEEEFALAGPFTGKDVISRWLRSLLTSATVEVEHLVERLARGVPVAEIEKFTLEQGHFVMKLTGFEHELKISEKKMDTLEVSTMLVLVNDLREVRPSNQASESE